MTQKENANRRRNFFAADDFWQRLMLAAIRYDTSCSEIIREAVVKYLDAKEKVKV